MSHRRLTATKLLDLRAAGVTGVVLDWAVDATGGITVLSAKRLPEYRRQTSDGYSFFQSFAPKSNHFTISHCVGIQSTHVQLQATRENFTNARALPDGSFLLVRARRRRGETLGGVIVARDGRLKRRFNIGDGVEHLAVAGNGHIWTSYSDEAYMNRISHYGGLARFASSGKMAFRFNKPLDGSPAPADLLDCYAMAINVDGSVDAVVYPGFRVVTVTTDGDIRFRNARVPSGCRLFVANDTGFLCDGGYGRHDALFLRAFGKPRSQRLIPVTARGRPVRWMSFYCGRGMLYLMEKEVVYAVQVPLARSGRGETAAINQFV